MRWYWLSFSDPELPDGRQFLGALILPGETIAAALMASHERGLNPGGACSYFRIPPKFMPAPQYRERLLSYTDLVAGGLLE